MKKSGFDALEKMLHSYVDKGIDHFDPDVVGLDDDGLVELSLAGVVERTGNIKGDIVLDIDAARRFLKPEG